MAGDPTFERLLAEGGSVPLEGWDFSWFEGRATEERPRWGYFRLLGERMARAAAALDIQTGGGEVLAGSPSAAGAGGHRVLATEHRCREAESAPARRGGGRGSRR